MKHEYPKWIYHKEKEAKLVRSKEEHKGHGSEWSEAPHEAKAEEVEPQVDEAPKRGRKKLS